MASFQLSLIYKIPDVVSKLEREREREREGDKDTKKKGMSIKKGQRGKGGRGGISTFKQMEMSPSYL